MVVAFVIVAVKHSISALWRRAQCPARTSEIIVRGSDHGANNGIERDPAAQRGILTPAKSCRLERAWQWRYGGGEGSKGEGPRGISSREDLSFHSVLAASPSTQLSPTAVPSKTSTKHMTVLANPCPLFLGCGCGLPLHSHHSPPINKRVGGAEVSTGAGPWLVFYRDFIRGEK